MTFPPDRTMLTLAAMACTARGRYSPDGRLYAAVGIDDTGGKRTEWEVRPSEIDTLEAEGWVELLPPEADTPDHHARVRVTDRGDYWLCKWLKANRRKLADLLREHSPPAPCASGDSASTTPPG